MTQSMESNRDRKDEISSVLGKVVSGAADLGKGLYLGALENPINGAVQLTNHIAHTDLPELHFMDQERLSHSAAGALGTIAGTALDIYVASKVTAGIAPLVSGSSKVAGSLRVGTLGAGYTTVFQPTDAQSDHFFKDRLTNGAVAFPTFAAMGLTAGALDSTGLFAVREARSLTGSIAFGALSGAGGGAVHAEANAIVKQGQLLPNGGDFVKDVSTYAAFGTVFGAADFVNNSLTAPTPRTFNAGEISLTVHTDSQGNPVMVQSKIPEIASPRKSLEINGTKMTDGHWSSSPTVVGRSLLDGPQIDKVQIQGDRATIAITKSGGEAVHHFIDVSEGTTASQEYSVLGNLVNMRGTWPTLSGRSEVRARLTRSEGTLYAVDVIETGNPSTSLKILSDGDLIDERWNYYDRRSHVGIVPSAGVGHPAQLLFTPYGGGQSAFFDGTKGLKPVTDMLGTSGQRGNHYGFIFRPAAD